MNDDRRREVLQEMLNRRTRSGRTRSCARTRPFGLAPLVPEFELAYQWALVTAKLLKNAHEFFKNLTSLSG